MILFKIANRLHVPPKAMDSQTSLFLCVLDFLLFKSSAQRPTFSVWVPHRAFSELKALLPRDEKGPTPSNALRMEAQSEKEADLRLRAGFMVTSASDSSQVAPEPRSATPGDET